MSKFDLEDLEYDLYERNISSVLKNNYNHFKRLINKEDVKAVYARNFYNDMPDKEFFLFFENKIVQVSTNADNKVFIRTNLSMVTSIELTQSKNTDEGIALILRLKDSSVLEFHSLKDSNKDYREILDETLKEIYTYYFLRKE